MEHTKGELHLVSETEYDHVIYLRDKPNRRDKIVARFINKDDALLFLAAPKMYEAIRVMWAMTAPKCHDRQMKYVNDLCGQALAKAEGKEE